MHSNTSKQHRLGRKTGLAMALGAALSLAATGVLASQPLPANDSGMHQDRFTALTRAMISGQAQVPQDAHRATRVAHSTSSTASTWTVTSCDDSGPGTLRAIVDNFAQSGDTIDMSGLNCTINLQTSIVTSADDLTIKANNEGKYGLNGGGTVTPLVHTGTGTLTLDGMTVQMGSFSSATSETAKGGCIYSAGSVRLQNRSQVKYCQVENTGNGSASGAGIYAAKNVNIDHSIVTGSNASAPNGTAKGGGIFAGSYVMLQGAGLYNNSASGSVAVGGGLYATDSLTSKYAMIGENSVTSTNATIPVARGGGAWLNGHGNTIRHTTIYGNTAQTGSGLVISDNSSASNTILNSTIANNKATASNNKYGGALHIEGNATITSSTISGNTEANSNDKKYGAGIHIQQGGGNVKLTNTVVGGNFLVQSGGNEFPSDIAGTSSSTEVIIQGDHNLVTYAMYAQLPGDTIGPLVEPELGPLQDNGGVTLTMSPLPGSPLIDAGQTSGNIDQRGNGFVRGVGGADDIGAIEVGGDRIFANGFD